MSSRTIAIGDVHGCADALSALVKLTAPRAQDTVILLGDLIDRGPGSRSVIDQSIALSRQCRLAILKGNHEEMALEAIADPSKIERWIGNGGGETLSSYGWRSGNSRRAITDWIPAAHIELILGTRDYFETDSTIFVHAGYVPELPMSEQPELALRWRVCSRETTQPHCSGKRVIVGHTPQRSGEVLDLGFVKCIDTNCVRGGWLTALEVESGDLWQVDRHGKVRGA